MCRNLLAELRHCAVLTGVAFLLVPFVCSPPQASWFDLGGESVATRLLQSSEQCNVLEITVGGFTADPVEIGSDTYYEIRLPGESICHERGLPALPDVRRSLIIPGDRGIALRVLSAEYRDFPDLPVAPSKGPLPRSIDPATVPYEFDAFYTGAGAYPAERAELHDPYILRDFRGIVLDANVFQYFPATRTLRVYTKMIVEVTADGPAAPSGQVLDPQFTRLYERHFLNFARQRYDPILEDGSLLIISYDAFRSAIEPLYQWKLQKGIPTRLVNVSEVGTTAEEIKDYVRNEYQSSDLAYVLLVGDAAQVPTFVHSDGSFEGGADPCYATVAGDDSYPDLFVGRFSAETTAEVMTQVARTIAYERDPTPDASWIQYGTGIASDQGPGHNGEYDNEHMEYIRQDLLAYGYVEVDSFYAPLAEPWMVAEALDQGRGLVDYCGHGSTIGWHTSGFDTSRVNDLINVGRLPVICSVACRVGKFDNWTCFAEVWLRATHEGQPTGAAAVYMSSLPQDWAAPMTAQDEAVDLLIADARRTIGGLWFSGACRMIDDHGLTGIETFLTWNIFGDPSLAMRRKTPAQLTVAHVDTLYLEQSEYAVSVAGVPQARCTLYADGVVYGTALTDEFGQATIPLESPPQGPVDMLLTVTAYNHETVVEDVLVIPSSGPCLDVAAVEYDDGNLDGILNAGEPVAMRVLLRNTGLDPATGVSARIATASEYVQISVDSVAFPNIPGGGELWGESDYIFAVAADCPDQHDVTMPVTFATDQGSLWDSAIDFTVLAPEISIATVAVDDSAGGNGNGTLDPGESAAITVTLANGGSYALDEIIASLSCSHPMIHVIADTGEHPGLAAGAEGNLDPAFAVHVDAAFPLHLAICQLAVTGTNNYERILELPLRIGEFFEDVESGAGGWDHYAITEGFGDQWHISDRRNHSPDGAHSWWCGAPGDSSYDVFLDAGLVTPPIDIGPGAELSFWMWIDAETALTWPDSAYDGALVEISLGGGPFTQITPVGGYPYFTRLRSAPNTGPFPYGTPVFCGSSDWQSQTFELGTLSGTAVFRFRFGSDGTEGTGPREGWYVDDVEVIGLGSPAGHRTHELRPGALLLRQSAPNPFAAQTRIAFALPQSGRVMLRLFDAQGRLVRTLLDGPATSGVHSVTWNGLTDAGHAAASGVYYYRLRVARGSQARSLERVLILLR